MAGLGLDSDVAAVGPGYASRNRQTQPCSIGAGGKKWLEKPRLQRRINAASVVDHAEAGHSALLRRLETDGAAGLQRLHGVFEQVGQRAGNG